MLSLHNKGSNFVAITVTGDEDVLYTIKSEHTEDIEALSGSTTIISNLDPQKEYTFTSSRIEEVTEKTLVSRVIITNPRLVLSLAEVQLVNSSGNTNFASRGIATQSSTSFGGVASRAIDGNVSQNWTDGGITHTSRPGWWKLTFTSPVPAAKIIILNRNGSASLLDRLRGSILQIYDQNGDLVLQKTLTAASRQAYNIESIG